MQFYELEPFGPERDNYHAAILASILVNIHRTKNSKEVFVSDFMYRDEKTKAEDDTRDFINQLKALAKPKDG